MGCLVNFRIAGTPGTLPETIPIFALAPIADLKCVGAFGFGGPTLSNSLPLARHRLTCERCHRAFSAKRSDARFCSHRCQRRVDPAVAEPVADELPAGWRRMGGYIVPPRDECFTFTIFPDRDA